VRTRANIARAGLSHCPIFNASKTGLTVALYGIFSSYLVSGHPLNIALNPKLWVRTAIANKPSVTQGKLPELHVHRHSRGPPKGNRKANRQERIDYPAKNLLHG
jgi:hypothetical protein